MKNSFYSDKQLTEAYTKLNTEQRMVLDEHVRRGKKTKWLNILARQKGKVLTENDLENPEEAMMKLLEWKLIDYIDALQVDPELKCDCGRSLRHRYTVLHLKTNKVHHFGINHLQQHTDLDPETVRLVMKGLKEIDLEKEEILGKVIKKWKLPFDIPKEINIPNDMTQQINVKLPLLDRQIFRLNKLIMENRPKPNINIYSKVVSQEPNVIPKNKRMDSNNRILWADRKKEESEVNIEIDVSDAIRKLLNFTINSWEAKQLYHYIKKNRSELAKHNTNMDAIRNAARRSLGKISTPTIRRWLIEIEEL